VAGLAILGWLNTAAWSGHWTYITGVFRTVEADAPAQPYGCISSDCGACLAQIDAYPDGWVFTGGSGGAYGFDLGMIEKQSNRKIANCILYGTTLDGFPLVLNRRNKLAPQQILLHALNTWVMIDGGAFVPIYDRPDPEVVYFMKHGAARPSATSMKWTIYPIMLERHFSELQIRWRNNLRRDLPRHAIWLSFFPLSFEQHVDLKEKLMERSIKISPWALSFLRKVDAIPSLDSLRQRLARIRHYLTPPAQMVLFNMPEYTSMTQAQRAPIFAEAKLRFTTALKELAIDYVDIDYEACGLRREHFWKAGAFVLDPVHPNEDAKNLITNCFLTELNRHRRF
jgi:hypothetical protein